ncbi:polysaccharide pyruvyl transferase family protein [Spongiibacter taiwanensis]|uniref:polysaccharide pyruvyl transferase family protein n=1 Tax=Spongiibacter taiwanensis TaxID=1748242 RepID=UPI002034F143|nr:polysaccharide pyruvyl transferase family protein [Spongiibacter taiwanensis]USA42147.1 polysaccharide pyruvyl transferase family protein [Spongiibacter taiwanensis]
MGESKVQPKVLIVTLSKSLNYGAYLQAYALQSVLQSRRLDTYFLDLYDLRQNVRRFKSLFKKNDRNFSGLIFGLKKLYQFWLAEKKFKFLKKVDGDFSAAFFGADEIWSLVNNTFVSCPEFYGLNLEGLKKYSYAPSAGNTTVEIACNNNAFRTGVRGINRVSVRDKTTQLIASEILGSAGIPIVLDPAFLADFPSEEFFLPFDEPYAVVYSYGLSKSRAVEIRNYADRAGLKLVSPGFNNDWCDLVVACSPFQFLTIIQRAQCVFTDTFHGTVFSIKYEKNFVSFARGKNKVVDLLERLNLLGAVVDDGDVSCIDEIVTCYSGSFDALRSLIDLSNNFINECVADIFSDVGN